LWRCFTHLKVSPIFGHHVVVLLLIVHLLIGYRRLREMDYYRDDPMVKRLLGLSRIPMWRRYLVLWPMWMGRVLRGSASCAEPW
jgi:hypothetical protein